MVGSYAVVLGRVVRTTPYVGRTSTGYRGAVVGHALGWAVWMWIGNLGLVGGFGGSGLYLGAFLAVFTVAGFVVERALF
jgi:hypothetical protein